MHEKEAFLKYNARTPRYTSYPTAIQFGAMEASAYAQHLASVTDPVSLYVHVPFCTQMCWYCGCNTTATRRHAPVADYLALMADEMRLVQATAGRILRVEHIHFGGGSPSILTSDDFRRFMDAVHLHFNVASDAEIALEADPRHMTPEKARAFAAGGVNRASFGVQDFNRDVQAAIGRVQSFEAVERSAAYFRDAGVINLNLDLMYGLPLQTGRHVEETVEQSLRLKPQRVAVFGYAHVPWMKKHMRLIADADLPDAAARLEQFARAEEKLCADGFQAVGIDHFVTASDDMWTAVTHKTLRRNFQGYTTDRAEALIGLGASSISRLSDGYFQNASHLTPYAAAIQAGTLATTRGCPMAREDHLRAHIISDLMCYLAADVAAILRQHGYAEDFFDVALRNLTPMAEDGLLTLEGGRVRINPALRQAARLAAACFDGHFQPDTDKHVQAA